MKDLNVKFKIKENVELQGSEDGCRIFADLVEVEVLRQKFQRLTVVDPYNPNKHNLRRKALDFGVALEIIAKNIQHQAKYGRENEQINPDGTRTISF